MKATMILVVFVVSVTLTWLDPAHVSVAAATTQPEERLRLTGCLVPGRMPGMFALHMEHNRIAVMGHTDLARHARRFVTLVGSFEERDGGLRFVVDEITSVLPSCDATA